MRDKGKNVERVGVRNAEIDGERTDRERQVTRSCLIMLCAVYKNVQEISSLAGNTCPGKCHR